MKRKATLLAVFSAFFIWVFTACDLGTTIPNPVNTAQIEQQKLQIYLDSLFAKGYDVDTTDLGVYYITIEEGEGAFPKTGDTLEVGFSGYLMGGQLFDASNLYSEDGKWEFELGNPPMIAGWENGMTVINKGAKVQLMIPSEHAYGETGNGIIGPYETLIFVVEMYEIKPSS